ncbi:uncharacterized protein [Aegilops tauschii subsp. strangulata]
MLDDDDDGDDDEVNFEDEDDDEFNPAEIVCDPAHRQQIADYHPNIQDQQPGSSTHFGYDVFTKKGFRDWKHAYQALPAHVGGVNSAHNKARLHYDDFRNQRQSVSSNFARSSKESEVLYKIRLHTSLGCARYLIAQGLAFRGHDESSTSLNKGNFREMVDWHKARDEKVRHAFDHGSRSCKMLAAEIQKDLAKCCAEEVTKAIMREIGDKKFSVLIDESRDISVKEQMAVMLRYVNDKGKAVERFLSLYHVSETTSEALKVALVDILDHHKLSIHSLRGQGYDGASNMRGEFNGLQKKILDENPYAFYVHCFAHRLQLVVVSVASCCSSIHDLFEYVSLIVSTTTVSCKRRDSLREERHQNILDQLESGEIFSGRGLNQETNLARPGDTRWGSHHTTLLRLSQMWKSVIYVLREVNDEGRGPSQAAGLIEIMESFKFAFVLHLMIKLLAITNELSQVLQRKDINIVNAIELVGDVKARLASMRESGWESLFDEVQHFCVAKGIPVPDMNERIPVRGRSRLDGVTYTNLHFYRVEIFYVAIDKICTEMNHRFNEASSNIIVAFSCLHPKNSFSKFDVDKLASLTEVYHGDFSSGDRAIIRDELQTYILHVRRHEAFSSCKDIESLATTMVETEKHLVFPLVYRIIELALLLPVSTASVERAFSAMKIIKSKLRSKMIDTWFNDLMICYTEQEIFKGLDDDAIIKRFQAMKYRKGQLPRSN